MAVLQIGSKCSHTNVYAPLLILPAHFEYINILKYNAKSRRLREP